MGSSWQVRGYYVVRRLNGAIRRRDRHHALLKRELYDNNQHRSKLGYVRRDEHKRKPLSSPVSRYLEAWWNSHQNISSIWHWSWLAGGGSTLVSYNTVKKSNWSFVLKTSTARHLERLLWVEEILYEKMAKINMESLKKDLLRISEIL